MAPDTGLTAEQYRAVVAIVDERLKDVRVTREAFDRLVEAQTRTEERLAGVEAALERLAEAQARTEEEIGALARDQRSVRRQLGRLSALIGAGAEARAEEALIEVLKGKAYQVLGRARPVSLDGEVDLAVPVADADGQNLWVLLEARARLRKGDVREWERRLETAQLRSRLRREGIEPPFLPYAFGLRVYRDAEEQALAAGIGLLSPAGELVEPSVKT